MQECGELREIVNPEWLRKTEDEVRSLAPAWHKKVRKKPSGWESGCF